MRVAKVQSYGTYYSRKSRGSSDNDPKNVKPAQCVKEYQDEPFTVSNCKLFCMGCREEICVKKSSIENLLRSLKHRKGKERLKQKELSIAKSLEKYNNQIHSKGETLPPLQQVFRVRVMQTFLRAGVPLNKIG